jgi:hypothetical protein
MNDIKLKSHIAAFVGARQLRNKPYKLVEFIRRNKQYFPGIKEEWLQKILDEENKRKEENENENKLK